MTGNRRSRAPATPRAAASRSVSPLPPRYGTVRRGAVTGEGVPEPGKIQRNRCRAGLGSNVGRTGYRGGGSGMIPPMRDSDLSVVVAAAVDGDRRGWDELVRRFGGLVWATARSFR